MKKLTHINKDGRLAMVDVGAKPRTRREAIAAAVVRMKPATRRQLVGQTLPKGDVFAAARIAGIMAAKQTSALIPLTHPLLISRIDVDFDLEGDESAIGITATVQCEGKTGVEIEAMTACAIAALTIYDMCKSIDREMSIDRLRLLRKSGGKSGTFVRKD